MLTETLAGVPGQDHPVLLNGRPCHTAVVHIVAALGSALAALALGWAPIAGDQLDAPARDAGPAALTGWWSTPATRRPAVDRRFLSQAFLQARPSPGPTATAIRPVDLPPDFAGAPPLHRARCHSRSVAAVKSYWQQVIFSGRGVPPPELETDEAVLRFVARHPGAIGYVSGSADVRTRQGADREVGRHPVRLTFRSKLLLIVGATTVAFVLVIVVSSIFGLREERSLAAAGGAPGPPAGAGPAAGGRPGPADPQHAGRRRRPGRRGAGAGRGPPRPPAGPAAGGRAAPWIPGWPARPPRPSTATSSRPRRWRGG